MPTLNGLKIYQGGPEVTPGTPVAATRKFALENLDWRPTDAVYRPRIVNGMLIDNRGGELVISRGAEWTATGPLIYDELHRWASMVIGPDVITGASPPYTHTFTRNPATNPTLKSWTMERRLSDGSAFIDNEWSWSLARSLTLAAGNLETEPVMLTVEGIARRILGSTLTSALTQVNAEIAPGVISGVWIDPTWATLGATQVLGQVLTWEVTFRSGINPIKTADQRTELDFGALTVNDANVGIDIKLRMLVNPGSAQYATEKTAAEAQSIRAVRIKFSGTASRDVQIDAICKHVAGSLYKVDEVDGYEVVDVELVSTTDLTNAFVLTVKNVEATL